MSVRIEDVAKKAGVSIATVSRVLNFRKGVSSENRKKVLSVIKKMKFHPNGSARCLAMKGKMIELQKLLDLPTYELVRIIRNAAEEAWNCEVIDTDMLDLEVGEGKQYADKKDWLESKIEEWR